MVASWSNYAPMISNTIGNIQIYQWNKFAESILNTCYIFSSIDRFSTLCMQRVLDILNINIKHAHEYFHVTCGHKVVKNNFKMNSKEGQIGLTPRQGKLLYSISNSVSLFMNFVTNSLTSTQEANPGRLKKSMKLQTFSNHFYELLG
jgi:hypothetical protein